MNLYETIPMTDLELKCVRALVYGARDQLLINGSEATHELDSLKGKLDVAARRLKQREHRELKDGK